MIRYRMDKPTLMWVDENGAYVDAVEALAVIDGLKLRIAKLEEELDPVCPYCDGSCYDKH